MLYKFEREINSLDTGSMSIRVFGTVLEKEMLSLIGNRGMKYRFRKRLVF